MWLSGWRVPKLHHLQRHHGSLVDNSYIAYRQAGDWGGGGEMVRANSVYIIPSLYKYSSSCVGGKLVQVTHQLAWHLLTIPSLVDDLCVKELKGRLKIGAYIHCAQRTMVLHLRLSQAIWTLQCWTSSIPSLPHSLYVLSLFSSLATIPPSSQRLLCYSRIWS